MSATGKTDRIKPDQLSLGFPEKELALESLIVSDANETAVSVLSGPQNWPFPVVCLRGAPRSGLTVLARAWSREFDGSFYTARDFSRLKPKALSDLSASYVAIDDADRIKASENLLSLINSAAVAGGRVLLAAKTHPSQWDTTSADLKSRLMALPVIEIAEPDERMLEARLEVAAAKHFLKLDPEIVKYLVPRLELSYEAVETFVESLNDTVTMTGRAPSVPLAREVLEAYRQRNPEQDA